MACVYEDFDPAFAAVCSDVTLYSNNKGFFKDFVEQIICIAEEDDWLKKFEEISEKNKIPAVLENETIMDALKEVFLRIEPMYRSKDARISHDKRMLAMTALKEGDLTKGLALASQAVLRAPMTGVRIHKQHHKHPNHSKHQNDIYQQLLVRLRVVDDK